MKDDGGGKRKLSKRKDPEAAVHYYAEQGYPADSVMEYLMTIASSDFEDWRRRSPKSPRSEFPFNLKKMSVSGALFDIDKLNDVSKTVISGMDAEQVTQAVLEWAKEYSPEFYTLMNRDYEYTKGIFSVDRGGPKPRKDIAKWSDTPDYTAYFFDETYAITDELPENINPRDGAEILDKYTLVYDAEQDKQQWFETIKAICPQVGFCPEVKEYKKNPEGYKGHAGDVSTIIRIAVTGRRNTPDLCGIMRLLGKERVLKRLQDFGYNLSNRI
jgi:glutamyl-tRNA synthetase